MAFGFGYVCLVTGLDNREIVAFGVSLKHDDDFALDTLQQNNLSKTDIFHSDRGRGYVNGLIDELLSV